MTINIFEYAARNKLRFDTEKGEVYVEDLYDMPLKARNNFDLDTTAKMINRCLKQQEEESFVSTPTKNSNDLSIKLDIVKHIIAVKLEEKNSKEQSKANEAQRKKLQEVIARKKDSALEALSVEDLEKMAAELS